MKKIFLSLTTAVLILSACNDNATEVIPSDNLAEADLKVTAESVATTEASIDDVVEAVEYEVELYSGTDNAMEQISAQESGVLKSEGNSNQFKTRYRWGKCPNITISSEDGTFPKTITLDYGESTELMNGRILSGVVQIVVSDKKPVDGATRTITYENFFVDGVNIAGTVVKTFNGIGLEDRVVTIIRNIVITLPEGVTIIRTAEKTRTWLAGLDTPKDHSDDVIEITGFVSCEDSDDNSYRREITTALVKKGDCRFVVSGEVTITKNDSAFAVVDYGDGECDNIATITTEEGTKEIVIGQRKREKKQSGDK